MSLFDERIAYKPFEYPEYYTEGWLKQAQAFWLHTEIPMSGDVKDWNENLPNQKKTWLEIFCWALRRRSARYQIIGRKKLLAGFQNMKFNKWL